MAGHLCDLPANGPDVQPEIELFTELPSISKLVATGRRRCDAKVFQILNKMTSPASASSKRYYSATLLTSRGLECRRSLTNYKNLEEASSNHSGTLA